MALDGQPPWHEGNAQGYILLEEICGGFATVVQIITPTHREGLQTRIILTEWVRHHAGGRDAESDDYYWELMTGIRAVGFTLGQLAKLNMLVEDNT